MLCWHLWLQNPTSNDVALSASVGITLANAAKTGSVTFKETAVQDQVSSTVIELGYGCTDVVPDDVLLWRCRQS